MRTDNFAYILLLIFPSVSRISAQTGNEKLDFGALLPGDPAAGHTVYRGQGTFYGQQPGQDDKGSCSYGAAVSNTMNLEWTSGIQNSIALNSDQFQAGLACGLCAYYRGTGGGIGTTPVSSEWQFAFINNICPECSSGDIDLNLDGDGRWQVEWFPAPCQVKNGTFKYVSVGDASNPYWFQFSVSNTRVPVRSVDMSVNGNWVPMRRTYNNLYAANGGPFNYWPLPLRITSVLGDVVYDQLASKTGGQGQAQFPDRGPATFPDSNPIAQGQSPQKPSSAPVQSQNPPSPPQIPGLNTTQGPSMMPSIGPSQNSVVSAFSAYVVSNYGQCGGNAYYCNMEQNQCKDAIWDLSSCNPGYTCQRQNVSWWGCQPASAPPKQYAGVTKQPSSSLKGRYEIADGGQCGGSAFYCDTLASGNCIDSQWQGAQCSPSRTCIRRNATWWSCEGGAGSNEPASATPPVTAFSQPPQIVPATGEQPSPPASVSAISSSLGQYVVPAEGQCGGDTSYCKDLMGFQCKDAVWNQAQCPEGYTCTRINSGWWQCMQGGQSPNLASASASGSESSPETGAQVSAFLETSGLSGRKLRFEMMQFV